MPAGPVHPATVAVTLYNPLIAVVALARVGFCVASIKLGPVHAYVAFAIVDAVRFNVDPSHIGLFEPAVGATGIAFTCTDVAAVPLHPFASLTSILNPCDAVASPTKLVNVGVATVRLLS